MNKFWLKIRKSSVAIFLIVAMFLGSFSQIAQAATGELCLGHMTEVKAGVSEQALTSDIDQHCADQANLDVSQDKSNKSHSKGKSSNHGCCATHCCVIKAVDHAEYKSPYQPLKETPLFTYESVHSSDFLFGIFRPPRLTV